jgi:general secretion pathway protein G
MKHRKKRYRGFTLIELLLVMVILVVLAAIVMPRFTGRSQQARVTAARTDISHIELALKMFETDNGRFPSSEEGLQALITQPAGAQNWHGPYLEKGVPVDPWSNPYVYAYPGTHNPNGFDLSSTGPDGREGTDDVTNWQQ